MMQLPELVGSSDTASHHTALFFWVLRLQYIFFFGAALAVHEVCAATSHSMYSWWRPHSKAHEAA